MDKLFEKSYSDEISAKDGGFIFQAILNYDLRWSIVDGETALDQKNIQGRLKQVDVFPDLKFDEGHATLTYVILSEVNLLKRKFELASEAIKRLISPDYAKEMAGETPPTEEETPKPVTGELEKPEEFRFKLGPDGKPLGLDQNKGELGEPQAQQLGAGQQQLGPGQKQLSAGQKQLGPGQKALPPASESRVNEVLFTSTLTAAQRKSINDKYFKGTIFEVKFGVNRMVLREVSTSGLDTGAPNVTLKLSTGMVDTLDGSSINSWDGFEVKVTSGMKTVLTINNSTEPKISEILVYDPIENVNELIFRTILPSLVLEFRGDRVQIDNYSNRSSQISIRSNIDFENLFNLEDSAKSEIEEPEEGEEMEEPEAEEEKPTATLTVKSSSEKREGE